MNLFNEQGYISCIPARIYTLESRVVPNQHWETQLLAQMRKDRKCDFVYDKIRLNMVVDVLQPNEILLVHKINDYFKINLTTYQQQLKYYVSWCGEKNLNAKNANNLKRFIEEVKIIWV